MVVRHEWEELSSDEQELTIEKKILIDEEIGVNGYSGFSVERTADGGLKLKNESEDEFGICKSLCEVILTKADLDHIKEFEQKGLI